MKKQKKITVKPYLNKKVKKSADRGYYPLYLQVIYDRNNTRFKDLFGGDGTIFLRDEDIERINNKNFKNGYGNLMLIVEEMDLIKDVVRYESNKDSNFQLRGIKERLNFYRKPIFPIIEMDVKQSYLSFLKANSNPQYYEQNIKPHIDRSLRVIHLQAKMLSRAIMLELPQDLITKMEAMYLIDCYDKENEPLNVCLWVIKDKFVLFQNYLIDFFEKERPLVRNYEYGDLFNDLKPKKDKINNYVYYIDNQVFAFSKSK